MRSGVPGTGSGLETWIATRLSLYQTIFPDMTKWLPVDEADDWQSEFNDELARLGVE